MSDHDVLQECLEAVCEDGCGVLAAGMPVYHQFVTDRAEGHAEATGHKTHTRTWAGEGT